MSFLVRTPIGDFRLVTSKQAEFPSEKELEDARVALFFAKAQLEARDAGAIAGARALARELGPLAEIRARADLIAMIEASVLGGSLVFEEQKRVPSARQPSRAAATVTQPPATPPPKIVPTSFEVRWVDEIGEPIEGLGVVFSVSGRREVVFSVSGRRETKTTGADGVAGFTDPDGSNFAFADVGNLDELREAVRPRWDTLRDGDFVAAPDALVVSLQKAAATVQLHSGDRTTISVQPFVARVRLLGSFFDTSKSFILPHGIHGIRAIIDTFGQEGNPKLLIVGHTDAAGTPDYNDVLSLERAGALKDYLTDNVDGWLEFYGSNISSEKRWGPKEDALMIGALPDEPTRDPNEAPVRWFQRTRSLTVDGVAGPQTRGQLVAEYIGLNGTSLPDGVEPVIHGCGENFPADPTPDGVADPENRRVEVFFFDGLLGIQPAPPAPNSGPGAPEYPEWVRRTRRSDDHVIHDGPQMLAFRLHDRSRRPMPKASAVVTMGDRQTPTDADDKGFIFILLPPASPDTIRIDWGPKGTAANFPFRYDAIAECDLGDDATRDRNRLHNLGYPLEEPFEIAAKQFQIDYAVDDKPRPAGLEDGKLPSASHELLAQIFKERDCDASTS